MLPHCLVQKSRGRRIMRPMWASRTAFPGVVEVAPGREIEDVGRDRE